MIYGVILGMGTDLCMIPRIERSVTRHGQAFLERIFTPAERAYAERFTGQTRLGCYAKRWAAKEACAKALGTGFSQGVHFQDISVSRDAQGAPSLTVQGGARAVLTRMIPAGFRAEIFVSLTDDPPFALAQVIIQAVCERLANPPAVG